VRITAAVLGCILGAGTTAMVLPGAVRADSPVAPSSRSIPSEGSAPPAVRPGTDAEAREYERREAASPGVQEFKGGTIATETIVIILVVLIVVIILL